jgi:hypothetical protein
VHKDIERHEVCDEKSEVSGAQEACAKVSEAWEGMRLWCAWVREGTQVMWKARSGVGICNEHEVMWVKASVMKSESKGEADKSKA